MQDKLTPQLRRQRCVCNAVFFVEPIQLENIRADLLRDNMDRRPRRQRQHGFHDGRIEDKRGMLPDAAGLIHAIVINVPVQQTGNISMGDLYALWHTGGAGGVQDHKIIIRSYIAP